MNPFQLNFIERLRDWHDIRLAIQNKTLEQQCVAIDEWWQRAPLVNHHIHPNDVNNWPDPWTLLHENEYSLLTRALGMIYSLHMIRVYDYKLVEATDDQGDDHYLVIVGNNQYTMNWHPRQVLNISLNDFTVKNTIDTTPLIDKLL